MSSTPLSLLERLRNRPEEALWKRLTDLYTPWIRSWLARNGVALQDADDLVQDILSVVVREMPRFDHDGRPGAFRGWLKKITIHRLRDFWRRRQNRRETNAGIGVLIEQLEDAGSGLSKQWEREHDQYVARKLLAMVEPDFKPDTWQAFSEVVLNERPADEVAKELNISQNAVWIAKSRVLNRLRQEAAGWIE